MNGTRLSVSLPGAGADLILKAAQFAEASDLDLWVGDPRGHAANSDDSYVTTTAGAVAAVTSHIRIGLFLTLNGSAPPLRLAEDIGVVDQASGGRLEVGLVVPGGDTEPWESQARRLLEAWSHWPAQEGRTVAVTPRPAQPWLPRVVVGDAKAIPLAERLRAGVVLLDEAESEGQASGPDMAERRVIVAVPLRGSARDWLGNDVVKTMQSLRATVDRAAAHEVLVVLAEPDPDRIAADLQALGVVVGTSLRCSPHQVELLALDSWTWLTELAHLHRAPEPA